MTEQETKVFLSKINELWPGQIKVTEATIKAWAEEFATMPVEKVRRSFRHYMDDPQESGDFPPTVKKLKKHAPPEAHDLKKTQAYWAKKYATDPAYRASVDEHQAKYPDRWVRVVNGQVRYIHHNE